MILNPNFLKPNRHLDKTTPYQENINSHPISTISLMKKSGVSAGAGSGKWILKMCMEALRKLVLDEDCKELLSQVY